MNPWQGVKQIWRLKFKHTALAGWTSYVVADNKSGNLLCAHVYAREREREGLVENLFYDVLESLLSNITYRMAYII